MSKFNDGDAYILYQALCNEIRLDQRYREIFGAKGFYINYKIMKQVALKRKFGLILTPAMFTLAWIMPAFLFARWILMLGISIGAPAQKKDVKSVWVVPTTPTNEALIHSALARNKRSNIRALTLSNLSTTLPSRLGVYAVLATGWQTLCLISYILLSGTNRTALLLHARDAISMLLLAKFARSHPSDLFATDCHYQRWSFVLSHAANDLILVQHGNLDFAIDLPFKGGAVLQAIVRDEASAQGWRQYYQSIREETIFEPKLELDANSFSHAAVFLASSFPTIDLEISFIQALRQVAAIPLIVKLHPAHRYDNRRLQLIALADYVCRPNENPACAVFVSHSSSMEMIYRQHGIPTVSLAKECTTNTAVAAAMHALHEDIHQRKNDQTKLQE
jgi:hypothetical protein